VAGRCRPRGPHVARSEGGAVGATCAICGASGTRGRSAAFGFLARADTKSLASHGGRLKTTRPAGIAAGRTATVRCAPGFGGGSWYKREDGNTEEFNESQIARVSYSLFVFILLSLTFCVIIFDFLSYLKYFYDLIYKKLKYNL
jgi:hypothetical protein